MAKDIMILGENAVFSTNCEESGVNNNVLIVGGSGSGKSLSIIEPRLLNTFDSSLVVTVTKRRIVDKYKAIFKERGYKVMDLNFTKPTESTVCYDPLDYISSYTDIKFLAESIVKSNPRKEHSNADPYWDDTACSLLCAEISYVLMMQEEPTFADVLKLNDKLTIKEYGNQIETSLDSDFNMISQIDSGAFAVTNWNTFKVLPYRTASCVCSALNSLLNSVFTPELRKMIEKKRKIDFEEIANKKTILFVSTSAVNPALNYFVNLFYSQMFKELFEYAESLPSGKLPNPIAVLADDFATGSRISNFAEYISIFREKQISVMILLQSESQLERMYGYEDSVTIIDNCDTYVYTGGNNLKSCRNVSERINRPLEDVLYMPVGQEFIFRRGQRPIITQRYNILQDKMYQKITAEYEKRIRELEVKERR